jgi:NAD(P)H-dependent flavin oxidoreductase YrpB (nitropropane dioxygenase family)
VIAAGGIFTGEDIYEIMKHGAQGVQMGTRFVATEECDADEAFKEAYVNARQEDIGIIKSPVGLPGRAIINEFLEHASEEKQSFKCPWQCLAGCKADDANYCISIALNNARKGRLARGFAFVGSNAYRVDSVVPAAALLRELEEGYVRALFNDMRGRVADIVARIRALREEYRSAEARLGEIRAAYEQNLTERFRHARKESLSALREEYKRVSARLTELRLKITERAFETYNLLMGGEPAEG